MKIKIVFALLLFNSTFLYSQNEYKKSVDSLYVLIKDTNINNIKINHYQALCDIYKDYDLKKFKNCNIALLNLAKKENITKGYGLYYSNKAQLNEYIGDYKQASFYSKKAVALFYRNKDWDNYFINCSHAAKFMSLNGDEKKAIALLNTTILNAKSKNCKYMFTLYFDFCYLYTAINNETKALKYAKLALETETSRDNKLKTYNLISEIYCSVGNYKKALEYNEIVNKQAKHSMLFYKNKNFKSKILFKLKRYQEAINLALEVRGYFYKQGFFSIYGNNTYFISKCYYELKNYQLAIVYIDKVLKNPLIRRSLKIVSYNSKAKICLALKDTKTAKIYVDEALYLLKEEDDYDQKINSYTIKEKLEETLGNYKLALFYQKKISAIKETNYINYNKNKLHQLEVDLDVTEKNNRIKKLQIGQLKNKVEITEKNSYVTFLVVGILVLAILVLFFVHNQKTIKNKNSLISLANTKLENEKNKTQKSLQEKETLLKEIHHRVKNNMQLVMSLLNIQAQETTATITDFVAISQSRILSMSLIHENLYQNQNLSEVDFKTYIENLTNNIIDSYNSLNNKISLQLEIDELYVDIQTAIPLGLIINELINNAYKHAFPNNQKGNITLKLISKENCNELIVSDTGVGFKKNEIPKNTLGLQLVEDLIFQLKGQLKIENQEGVKYTIQFNKS